ncbi:MAG: DUF1080 domain-containing protein [Chlorobi bacterium]|nr:DUF1080 domain-containing protein [Chlorobiota bacterium]
MKKSIKPLFAALLASIFLSSCNNNWEYLFNGDNLDNWDKYIGTPLKGFEEQALNATTDNVFSVIEKDGEKVIRISGEVNGSLATQRSFENYHLQLVFKWGDKVYTRRNSGLLYYSFGEFGAALGTWMPNIECQLMHGKLGDTYLMNNTNCETAAKKTEDGKGYIFSPGSPKVAFGEKANGRSIQKLKDNENPLGDWNTVDLYCFGRTAVHLVNGKTVMANTNCGIYSDGGIEPLSSGKIQIQSEGAELFVKSIKIRAIEGLPENILD